VLLAGISLLGREGVAAAGKEKRMGVQSAECREWAGLGLRRALSAARWATVALALGLALLIPAPARADTGFEAGFIGRLGSFLVPGGYFFTSDAARDALDDVLWYHEADFIRYGLGVGVAGVAFTLKGINASSEFTPFSGNTQFTLLGPSVQVWTAPIGRFRPFASAGLFAGYIKSDRRNISKWDFTPSIAAGVQLGLARFISLTASYRITEELAGIDTDGFSLRLSLF